ncbi:MAG: hypothetical protein JNL39_17105 [Opitutaceae bacterium]|nr:hypothetical protein [Opitutaceae bacterium]
MSLAPAAGAAEALVYPQLTALTRTSPSVVSPGSRVEFRCTIAPGTAATRSVELTIAAFGNVRGVRVLAAADPQTGVISAPVDTTWANGRYEVIAVVVADVWSRSLSYNADSKVTPELRVNPDEVFYAGPATHSFGFAPLAFTVTGASPVAPRPELISLETLSTSPLTAGQSARFRYAITPGLVPLAKVAVSFRHTTATRAVTLAPVIETSALTGEITLPIAASVMNGRYRLALVTLTDVEGRQTIYRQFGGVSEGWETAPGSNVEVESSNIAIQNTEFVVEGASTTVVPPRFTAWSRQSPAVVGPGAVVRFAYDAATVGYPVRQIRLRLIGPFGAIRETLVSASSGAFSFPVTADWTNGTYTAEFVTLTDAMGRNVSVRDANNVALAPFEEFVFEVRGGITIPPYFNIQPTAETGVLAGTFVSFVARGVGLGPVTYQWFRGEPGDTSAPFTPASDPQPRGSQLNVQIQQSTTFWVRITSAGATADSNAARVVVVTPAGLGRLINLSVLTGLDSPTDEFTLGYVVGGNGTSGSKALVLRAAGPSLGALGVPGTVSDPKLETFAGAGKTGENDNWGGGADLVAAFTAVGAFPYAGPTSRDAAVAASITTRDNSVRVTSVGGATGAVIAEVYDATPTPSFGTATPRLLNVSVRKHLGRGLTAGFVIGGSTNVRVLIRVIGPGIAPFGVAGTVTDPQLALFRGTTQIGANDDWPLDIATAGNSVGAFALTSGSRDAALVATLTPGNYSVLATGVGGTTGVALVEVYELP